MNRSTWRVWLGVAIVASRALTPATVLAQTIEKRVVRLNGIEMCVELRGAGEPLVLLHGFSQSARQWDPFVQQLASTYRVVVPDLRGHGCSTNPSKAFTHRQAALDVYALLDSLGIREFSAMGISSGGMTLLHMATQQAARVRSMVLVSATTHFPESVRALMRTLTAEAITPQQWRNRRPLHPRGDDQILELQAAGRAMADDTTDMVFTSADLAAISAQTLIVHGDRDPLFPVDIAIEMYSGIPESQLWIIPDGAHATFLSDSLVPFLAVATRFLK